MKLLFDAPGQWTHTWIEEEKDGKVVVTRIAKGETVEVEDLEDGSIRSHFLKMAIANKICRVVKEPKRAEGKE